MLKTLLFKSDEKTCLWTDLSTFLWRDTFTTPVRNRTKIYHSQPLAFHLAPAGETLPLKTILLYEQRSLYRGWLCRPLIVFYVTVFPSARARHSVPLGRVAHFITARAFTLSVPSLHSVPLGRGAVAPLKVRSSKSAILDGEYLHFFISLQQL